MPEYTLIELRFAERSMPWRRQDESWYPA